MKVCFILKNNKWGVMKYIIFKIAPVFFFSQLSFTNSFAQATASAYVSAEIVTQIGISKTVDMDFGSASVTSKAGAIILTPAGTRTKTGGVILSTTGFPSTAIFDITVEGAFTYAITLPNSCTITNTTGTRGETMTINAFISNPSLAAGGALTSGTQTIYVGATLNVGGSQVPGVYVNRTNFDVIVNYN